MRLHPIDNDENVFQSTLKKSSQVIKLIFLVVTFQAYAIKSITTIAFNLSSDSGTVVGHDSPGIFFTSLASSDLGDFRKLPSFVR